jgi:NADP-dependent 3-hydroxy acid dehydrogenase YdfG
MSVLANRIGVVTGAGGGIGQAIALALAKEDAIVYLVDIDAVSLERVQREADGLSRNLIPYKANLERDEEVDGLSNYLRRNHGVIDLLIHSIGVIARGKVSTMKLEDFDRQIGVNVRAPYAVTRALLPIIRRNSGEIVFINSSVGSRVGLEVTADTTVYAASKHALKVLADGVRNEVNSDGIRVMSVYPGRTATSLQERLFRIEGREYQPEKLLQPEDIAQIVIAAVKLSRYAEVTDLYVRSAQKWD